MIRVPRRRPVRPAWWAALVALVLLLAACTGDGSSNDSAGNGGGGSSSNGGGGKKGDDAPAASVEVQPVKGTANVAPAVPVVVTAKDGTLTDVTVAAANGQVQGKFDADKATWTSAQKLQFGTDYTVTATAKNGAGKETTTTSSFSTAAVAAAKQAFPAVSPLRGTTVGVGMPIRVYLSKPATDHKAVTDHLKVTTSVPTDGAWRWFSPTELHWRPKVYWKPNTQVALDVSLRGVAFGGGVWGGANADRHIEFTVGAQVISVGDARTHQLKTYKNGTLVKTMPTSMGKPGFETPSGSLVVTDKNRVKTMDSTTYGLALDAGGYRAKVEYATRISNGGVFVHSAPWSVAQQGHSNVSHGCLNLSPANATWFFNMSKVGDVVEVRGTSTRVSRKDGDIYDWSIPWAQWAN